MSVPVRYDPFNTYSRWFNQLNLMERPFRIFDQNFGGGLEDDLFSTPPPMYNSPLMAAATAPRHAPISPEAAERSGVSEVLYDNDKFQVMLDVKHFKPDEITVKSLEDCIVIHGHHTEKPDQHGYISRSFTRRYVLPEDVKTEHVECNLSSDGVLTLKAPRIIALKDDTERIIPVMQTGKPAAALPEQRKASLKSTSGPTVAPMSLHIMAAPPAPETNEKVASCGDEARKGGSASA